MSTLKHLLFEIQKYLCIAVQSSNGIEFWIDFHIVGFFWSNILKNVSIFFKNKFNQIEMDNFWRIYYFRVRFCHKNTINESNQYLLTNSNNSKMRWNFYSLTRYVGTYLSLLDNAPNYLVGCIIQKRFSTFRSLWIVRKTVRESRTRSLLR